MFRVYTLYCGIKSAHMRVNFFSFKIEETYTLTVFVNQILSFSVYSESMYSLYDSLGWLGFFDLSKFRTCWSFSVLKILTSHRPYSHSLIFPSKFPSVPTL